MSTPVEPAVAFAGAGADQHIVVSGDWVLGAVIRLQALVSAVLPVIPGTLARLDLSGIGRIDGAARSIPCCGKKFKKRNEKELRSSWGGVLKGVARNKAISGRN